VRGENLLNKFEKTSANSESHDRLAIEEEITQKRFLKNFSKTSAKIRFSVQMDK